MKTKTVWKVCRLDPKLGYMSAISARYAPIHESMTPARYQVKKWTKPKRRSNQFLFVFGTREQARMFKRSRPYKNEENYAVFEARIPAKDLKKTDWKDGEGTPYPQVWMNLPEGSMLASKVKLIKKSR